MIRTITREHLQQLENLLLQLNDQQLSDPLKILNGASIGSHMRHILEFYRCLFNSLETGQVNYDLRERDKAMECEILRCTDCLSKILNLLSRYHTDMPLYLYANYSESAEGETIRVESTYFRELLYNVEHTVHHLALIKIGLQALKLPQELYEHIGVAASTRRNARLCAQ